MRGATRQYLHLSPERGRFQSMLLMRGATRWYRMEDRRQPDFNPRSSCEERHFQNDCRGIVQGISIHAPHARSDLFIKIASRILSTFQSTLLMRGATRMVHGSIECIRHFNPRSSCEERRYVMTEWEIEEISIHAPHARSDLMRTLEGYFISQFQSTLLMRGATGIRTVTNGNFIISIHAPHARSDEKQSQHLQMAYNFNPRSSCEERLCLYYSSLQLLRHNKIT